MFTLKELEKYTNGKILNGDINKKFHNYTMSTKFYIKDGFFVPIDFHGLNREIYIINSVKLGGAGFMIEKNSVNHDSIIEKFT